MSPIEQLARLTARCGLDGTERREGSTGMVRIFEFDEPMPRSVRRAGAAMEGLRPVYWQAGHGGPLMEGFDDDKTWEKIHFRASAFSLKRLRFRWRQLKGKWSARRRNRRSYSLRDQYARGVGIPARLDRGQIGPGNGEYEKIEAAASIVSDRLEQVLADGPLSLMWSYGDSSGWLLVLSVASEVELADLLEGSGLNRWARLLFDELRKVVEPAAGFALEIEIDTDERVRAAEGWFLRLKGASPRDRRFTWRWQDEVLTPHVQEQR